MKTLPTVAFVSDAIYPYNKGGKETRLYEVTTRLAAKGYDVHLYCMKYWDGADERVEHGVHLHGICPAMPLYDGPRRSIKQGVLFGLYCFKLLGAKFDVADVDHMPFFPLYSMRIVCWLKRKKMIATWHEVWGPEYWKTYLGGFKGVVASLIEQVSVWWPDTIVAVSEMTAGRLRNDLGFKKELLVVSNGIDLEAITAAKRSARSSDVMYAGRLLKHKNIDVLVRAIALAKKELPDIRALIVGEGPEKERLVTLAKELKLEKTITFLPFQEQISEMYGMIKATKVFVLPSEREGFGLVVLEANACGAPVVTVDCKDNAARELIGSENGIVSDLSASGIFHAILTLIKKNTKEKNIASKLNQYEWSTIVNNLSKLYK